MPVGLQRSEVLNSTVFDSPSDLGVPVPLARLTVSPLSLQVIPHTSWML